MLFRKRVFGIENEFGVARVFPDGTLGSVDTSQGHRELAFPLQTIPHSISSCHSGQKRIWHTNGGCTYLDCGLPEHATPECASVRDALRYTKAGEMLVAKVFDALMTENGKLLLFKNNAGVDEYGHVYGQFGCHENYAIYTAEVTNRQSRAAFYLIPFLITRQIMDGAGWWTSDTTFLFSVRALGIRNEFGGCSTDNRPLIHFKATADTGDQRRLHIIMGDANILEFATYLKIGTTALIINLLENDAMPDIICSANGAEIIQAISARDALDPIVPIDNDQFSAFDIQVRYCEAARKQLSDATFECQELEAELKHIAQMWEQTLNAIYRRDSPWMWGRLDWATKRFIGEREIKRRKPKDTHETFLLLKDIDILYHEITDRTFQNAVNGAWSDRRLVSDREILDATEHPPCHTRAQCRGSYIDLLNSYGVKELKHIDWHRLENCSSAGRLYMFNCPYPLRWDQEKFSQFMALTREKYSNPGDICPEIEPRDPMLSY